MATTPIVGLKTDTSQMTPIFFFVSWQGELSDAIAELFRGQINATSGEKRKSDEVAGFKTASTELSAIRCQQGAQRHHPGFFSRRFCGKTESLHK